jgi:hypothetical protein
VRGWLAVTLLAGWVGQFLELWPLPSDMSTQLAATLPPEARGSVADLEPGMWLWWTVRAVITPVGMLSALLMMKNHRAWVPVVLAVSVGYVVLFRVWIWFPIFYSPLFASFDRAVYRGAWLLEHPRLVFDTLLFPAILMAAVAYAMRDLIHRRRARHAI